MRNNNLNYFHYEKTKPAYSFLSIQVTGPIISGNTLLFSLKEETCPYNKEVWTMQKVHSV